MSTNENPKEEVVVKCERCGSESAEVKIHKPNLGKHPGKLVMLCAKCAVADPKALPVDGVKLTLDATVKTEAEDPVQPQAGGAIPTPAEDEVKQFDAVTPGPIETGQQPIKDDETAINPATIRAQINRFNGDIKQLLTNGQKIRGQLAQITELIKAKRGAVAGLESVLK